MAPLNAQNHLLNGFMLMMSFAVSLIEGGMETVPSVLSRLVG